MGMLTDQEFLSPGAVSAAGASGRLSDDEFMKGKPEPKTGINALAAINRGAGSFATGANDALATTFGAPVDLASWGLNKLSQGANAAIGTTIPQIDYPIGGSQSLRDLIGSTLGRTDPKGTGENLLYGAGSGVGSVAAMPIAAGAMAARAPSLAAALSEPILASPMKNAALGAASGGGGTAAKMGAANVTDNPLVQALAEVGGGIGAPLAMGGAMMIPKIARGVGDLARPLSDSGQRQIAGRLLNESATFGVPAQADTPLGINATLGQRTNDPGLLALERVVSEGAPMSAQGEMANQGSQNSQIVRNAFSDIGSAANRTPEQISQEAATGLDTLRQSARADERAAWEQIDPNRETAIPIQPLRDAFDSYVGNLSAARRRFVPNDYQELLSGFGDHEPMVEVQDLRSMLTTQERQARRSGDYNTANVLRELDEALFQRLPENAAPMPSNLDQAATLRYQAALDKSRSYNQTFNQGDIRDIFRLGGNGADAVPDSAVLPKMLGSGKGQPERVSQFVNAAQGDEGILGNARDWFSTKMQEAGAGARQEATGEQALLGNKLRLFVQANRPLIDSAVFTPEQRQVVDDIVAASNMLERTARGGAKGASDTARLLSGNDYLSALVGGWAKPVTQAIPQALGGVGGFIAGGAGGAAAGAYGAKQVMGPVIDAAYGKARANVTNLLLDAVKNPEFARELMQTARPARSQAVSPVMRNYLATLPVTLETLGNKRSTEAAR